MPVPEPFARYLANHAEPLASALMALSLPRSGRVLVVPCYDESLDWLHALPNGSAQDSAQDRTIVVIVNAPTDAPAAPLERTIRLHATLRERLTADHERLAPDALLGRLAAAPHTRVLLVDRCTTDTRRLPPRQGVGLARKLGTDIALGLIDTRHPWIYQTDADARLPEDYFERTLPDAAACTFGYVHDSDDPELVRRARLYEHHLRLYRERLAAAGSTYAHDSIGSTLVLSARAYCAVRGFPRRSAGEDFHLLNKLAKVGPVTALDGAPVRIQARYSERVPFGTGPALAAMNPSTYRSYANESFELLADALRGFTALSEGEEPSFRPRTERLLASVKLREFLKRLEQQSAPPPERLRALHHWFDALRTLRFIHAARRYYPDKPIDDLIAQWDRDHKSSG